MEVKYLKNKNKLEKIKKSFDANNEFILQRPPYNSEWNDLESLLIIYNFDDVEKHVKKITILLGEKFFNINREDIKINFKENTFYIDFGDNFKLIEVEDINLFDSIKNIVCDSIYYNFNKKINVKVMYEKYLNRLKDKFIRYILDIKDKVIRTKKEIELIPMDKLVRDELHRLLTPFPEIITRSKGKADQRHIVIRYNELNKK